LRSMGSSASLTDWPSVAKAWAQYPVFTICDGQAQMLIKPA